MRCTATEVRAGCLLCRSCRLLAGWKCCCLKEEERLWDSLASLVSLVSVSPIYIEKVIGQKNPGACDVGPSRAIGAELAGGREYVPSVPQPSRCHQHPLKLSPINIDIYIALTKAIHHGESIPTSGSWHSKVREHHSGSTHFKVHCFSSTRHVGRSSRIRFSHAHTRITKEENAASSTSFCPVCPRYIRYSVLNSPVFPPNGHLLHGNPLVHKIRIRYV